MWLFTPPGGRGAEAGDEGPPALFLQRVLSADEALWPRFPAQVSHRYLSNDRRGSCRCQKWSAILSDNLSRKPPPRSPDLWERDLAPRPSLTWRQRPLPVASSASPSSFDVLLNTDRLIQPRLMGERKTPAAAFSSGGRGRGWGRYTLAGPGKAFADPPERPLPLHTLLVLAS